MLKPRYGSSKTISWKEANLGCIVHYKKKSELRRQKRRWAPLADSHPVLTVPFAAGFRVGVADIHCMPFSSGSVLFLGLQQRAKPWSWPLQLIYVLEETEHEGNNKSIQNVSLPGRGGGSSTCWRVGTVATILHDDRGLWGRGSEVMGSRWVLGVF